MGNDALVHNFKEAVRVFEELLLYLRDMKKWLIILTLIAAGAVALRAQDNPYGIDGECYSLLTQAEGLVAPMSVLTLQARRFPIASRANFLPSMA